MSQATPSASQQSAPSITLDINPIVSVHHVGGRGNPSHTDVQIGRVAVLSHNQEAFDQDGRPEVYLAGEKIRRSWLHPRATCLVAELAECPGTIMISAAQFLAGISTTPDDVASVRFLYHLRMDNPILLLSQEPRWTDPGAQQHLKQRIDDLIRIELESAFADNLQLWSHHDVRDVSAGIFSRLDATLKAWGLRLDSRVPAYRKYPDMVYEIALQFRAAERELLDSKDEARASHTQALQMEPGDLLEVQTVSENTGRGAGLFLAATNRKQQVQLFIDWLILPEQAAPAAAGFLRSLYLGNLGVREVELSEYVLLAAFRNPVLGLGEWGDAEQRLYEASQYSQLEALLDSPHEQTA